MTDNTLESGTTSGAGNAPSSPTQAGAGSGDSGGGWNQEAVLKRLNELDGLVRQLQSGKDKGIQQVREEVGSLKEQLARYEKLRAKGLDPEEAQYRMEVEQLLAEKRGGSVPTGAPAKGGGGSPTQPALIDHTALLGNLGLDANDPEVIGVLRSEDNELAQIAKFNQIATARKSKPAPPVSPAQQIPVSSGSSITVTTEALAQKYRELTKNIPQGDHGMRARFEAVLAIRKEAQEADVPSPV